MSRSPVSAKNTLYEDLVWVPLAWSVGASVLAGGVATLLETADLSKFLESLFSWRTLAIALFAWVIASTTRLKTLYGEDYEILETFRSLLRGFPPPLGTYAKRQLGDLGRRVKAEVSGLQASGFPAKSLKQKIQIIQSLVGHYGKDLTRYWATTLDSPSQMWRDHQEFWSLQENELKDIEGKRRLVVIPESDLQNEIEQHTEDIEKFVRWHLRQDNPFELLFLISERDEFAKQAQIQLDLESKDELVTDFAILGDNWVYGEVTGATQGTAERRLLRLYESDVLRGSIIGDYVAFYNDLWERWQTSKWHKMIPSQLISECNRHGVRKRTSEKAAVYYRGLGLTKRPPDSYEEIRQFIANITDGKILAVDIVPLKAQLLDWIYDANYHQWMKATMLASKSGADCHRVYVLKDTIEDLAVRQQVLDQVFLSQSRDGVKVYLVSVESLWEKGIPVHDFILVADRLCLSLAWYERFSFETVSVENNLAHPDSFSWFENVYARILDSGTAREIGSVSVAQALRYLETLKW